MNNSKPKLRVHHPVMFQPITNSQIAAILDSFYMTQELRFLFDWAWVFYMGSHSLRDVF